MGVKEESGVRATTIYIRSDIWKRFKVLCVEKDTSASKLVEELVIEKLKKEKKES